MLRTILFWTHLVAGVLAGILIVVMSVTGVALTYERQMTHWADMRSLDPVDAGATTFLGTDSLVVLATTAHGGTAPGSITRTADPTAPVLAAFGRDGVLYLDPASGRVLGAGSTAARDFFGAMEEWHRWLAGKGENRTLFKSANDAANLLFLLIVLTGMVLWLPKTITWVRVRAVLWFRSGLRGKARDFNWHNVLGIWSALPLIAIVASGAVISYPWASDLVYKAVGETPPPRGGPGGPPGAGAQAGAGGGQAGQGAGGAAQGAGQGEGRVAGGRMAGAAGAAATVSGGDSATRHTSLDAAIATAQPLMADYLSITVQVPKPGAKTIGVTLDRGTGGQPQHRATVQVASATGAVARFEPFDSLTAGRQARGILRFTHTGEVLGVFGQTIAGLVTLASVVLVVTGMMLAIRRAARALARRGSEREPSVAGATN
ncbi:MAG: PepSY domain-containing protein [Gemmatimonadaceae bacterium]|nr:PepSY domain-containing protein [Gemmatimonadaceae bacterium]